MLTDLTRTMFFKAGFDIETVSPEDDALWCLISSLRAWVTQKARRDGYSFPSDTKTWTQVKQGTSVRSENADVELTSCLHIEPGSFTWSAKFSETAQPDRSRAPRQWDTEVGFVGESFAKGRVSIVLSYGDRAGFIGPLQDEPAITTPALVRTILENNRLTCTNSGIPITYGAKIIASAREAFSLITSENREVPVVLLRPTNQGTLGVDPQKLAYALGPNAIVLCTTDAALAATLDALLAPYGLQCHCGALRIYAARPQISKPGDASRHRYVSASDIRANGEESVVAMLRRALAQDVHFWEEVTRLEDVRRLNRESSRSKRIAEYREKLEDETFEEMLRSEDRIREVEARRDSLEDENKRLKQRNYELEGRCSSYEDAFSQIGLPGSDSSLAEFVAAMDEMPSTPEELARFALAAFPDCIDFTERGWKSLSECKASLDCLWLALRDLAVVLRPLMLRSAAGDPAGEFNRQSRFSYARGEGPQTRKNARLMALREDVYQGRKIFIEQHIGSSTGDPNSKNFIRVYFDWDEPSKKIVIGHCGGHLENSTTASLH